MSAIDAERFRTRLLEERQRVARRDREHPATRIPGSLGDETEEPTFQDNHLGDIATATFDREMASTLEENSSHVLAEIDAALARIDDGTYGLCRAVRQADRRGPARGPAVGDALHRRQAKAGAGLTEPARKQDYRPGSRTDGLAPVSVAARSLAAAAGALAQPGSGRAAPPSSPTS